MIDLAPLDGMLLRLADVCIQLTLHHTERTAVKSHNCYSQRQNTEAQLQIPSVPSTSHTSGHAAPLPFEPGRQGTGPESLDHVVVRKWSLGSPCEAPVTSYL